SSAAPLPSRQVGACGEPRGWPPCSGPTLPRRLGAAMTDFRVAGILTPRTVTAAAAAAYGKSPLAQRSRHVTWMAAVSRTDVPTSSRRGHDGLSWVDSLIPHSVTATKVAAYGQVSACSVPAMSHVDGRRFPDRRSHVVPARP